MDELSQKAFIAVISLVVGYLLGHWLAVKRDRRKEFNELVDPIFLILDEQSVDPQVTREIDFRPLSRHFSSKQRERFEKDANEYYESIGPRNREMSDCQFFIVDRTRARNAAKTMLKWINRR